MPIQVNLVANTQANDKLAILENMNYQVISAS